MRDDIFDCWLLLTFLVLTDMFSTFYEENFINKEDIWPFCFRTRIITFERNADNPNLKGK